MSYKPTKANTLATKVLWGHLADAGDLQPPRLAQ